MKHFEKSRVGGEKMLTEKEKKMCRTLISVYKRKLKKCVSRNTILSAGDIVKE